MTLFEQFKALVPDNRTLCTEAESEILDPLTEDKIKTNFSSIFEQMEGRIYERYLQYEDMSGQKIINELIATNGTVSFQDMKSLNKSISQSRVSRAGKAFEYIISAMFTRLNYPFEPQKLVGGATPDFLMPSSEFFINNPLSCIIFTAKRTLRERWRQIVTEANKGYVFFLATIDKNISENQLNNAMEEKIFLVMPAQLKAGNDHYEKAPHVMSFERFFDDHLDPAVKRWSNEKSN